MGGSAELRHLIGGEEFAQNDVAVELGHQVHDRPQLLLDLRLAHRRPPHPDVLGEPGAKHVGLVKLPESRHEHVVLLASKLNVARVATHTPGVCVLLGGGGVTVGYSAAEG